MPFLWIFHKIFTLKSRVHSCSTVLIEQHDRREVDLLVFEGVWVIASSIS